MKPSVRFWEYHGEGCVKITLRPGQTLSHYTCYRHEEGWSSTLNQWTFEDGIVTCETTNDGRDCDGRLTSTYVNHFEAGQEHAGKFCDFDANVRFPLWSKGASSTYDDFAQAANY